MDKKITVKEFFQVNDEIASYIFQLESAIFDDPYSKEKILRESAKKHELIVLICFDGERAVGFKIGYELTGRLFYSWLGGVDPAYRGQGIARLLMDHQHQLVSNRGYKMIRTHTQNKFREMLIFNIKYGFDISGVFKTSTDDEQTIILEKELP